MNSCDHCEKGAKFLFVCPKCDGKFCKEHRGLYQHNCSSLEPSVENDINVSAKPESVEIEAELEEVEPDKEFVQIEEPLEQPHDDTIEIKPELSDQKESQVGLLGHASPIILILAFLTFGILLLNGNLTLNFDNSKYVSMEEYMVLQSDNMQLQVELEELKKLNDELEVQYGIIQDLLDQKNEDNILIVNELTNVLRNYEDLLIEKEDLENKYNLSLTEYESIYLDSVFWNEYITNQMDVKEIPSTSQIKTWLQFDMTDEAFEYSRNSLNGMAIILSLSAQARNWQVGVLSVRGNFTPDINSLNFCFVQSVEGLLYIDPYLDRVFWYERYEEITPGRIYDFGIYSDVYVDDTVVIIPG